MDTNRARGYLLTIPLYYNGDRVKIRYIVDNFKKFDYFVFQVEKGVETGYKHYQLYLEHSKRVSFSTLKNIVPFAHIERREGTKKDAFEYCTKQDTRLHGPFEFGERPSFQDTNEVIRSKKEMLLADVMKGKSDIELLVAYPTIFSQKLVNEYRKILGINLFTQNRDVVCTYITGVAGSGKSSYIRRKYGNENIYVVSDYERDPFGGYVGQNVIVFEEYRSQFPLSVFLQYLDIYPLQLPCRYSNVAARYTKVYVISNWDFNQQYFNCDTFDRKAFARRFKYYLNVTKEGIFRTIYDNDHKPILEDHCYNFLGNGYKELVKRYEQLGWDTDNESLRTYFDEC